MIVWLRKRVSQLTHISDLALLKRAQRGNREAFGKLYLKYVDSVYRYIFFRVYQQKEVAEDLCEMVFFRAWKNIQTFETNNTSFRPWLYTVARNCVIDYYREKHHERLNELIPDQKPSLEQTLIEKSNMNKLYRAINQLTLEQQQVIILTCIEELPFKEVSQLLNKREDAIRALKYRAIKQLRKKLV